ncbi:MAG TPA: Gfo/Idh/MocA family oxidoreductase [Victivallales bacterium]|nr:Gfo/Idh/MocA family oxidoreductase [Victivallales bacterium]
MSKSGKIKVGVVGVGALGKHHVRLYSQNKDVNLVGIYDINPENSFNISREFSVKSYPDIDSLARDCEALSVVVPADIHYDIAIRLLGQNKHLLIEKPIASKIEHAEEIVRLAEQKKLVLGVGHVERYNPVMSFLEERAKNTRFIEVHRLATYPPPRPGQHRRGTEVGVVLDLMIHDLDIILRLVNSEIERVDAVGIPVLSPNEDIANVRLKFKNGCVANITASRVSGEPMRRFRVFLNDAYLSLDNANKTGLIYKKHFLGIKKEDVPIHDHNALEKELEDFVNCVLEAKKTGVSPSPKVSGWHGLEALRLAVNITEEIERYNKQYGAKPPK